MKNLVIHNFFSLDIKNQVKDIMLRQMTMQLKLSNGFETLAGSANSCF